MKDTVRVLIDAWKLMAERFPSPMIEEADGVATCFGNVPLLFFNLWIQARPTATLDELRMMLATAAKRAAACQHASGGVLREDWMPVGWEELIKEAGLAPMLAMTGMEASKILPPRRPAPNLEIRRVVDDASARDLATLNATAYGMPVESFDCMANMRLWHDDSYACVGYAGGKAVSSAAALPVAGTVYIALVATAPDEQRKGYADAVMRQAIAQGQKIMGVETTTLHATDMGQPVYRAMGYTSGARFLLVGPDHE